MKNDKLDPRIRKCIFLVMHLDLKVRGYGVQIISIQALLLAYMLLLMSLPFCTRKGKLRRMVTVKVELEAPVQSQSEDNLVESQTKILKATSQDHRREGPKETRSHRFGMILKI